jgi:K+-sensing histidine kinase KdpD
MKNSLPNASSFFFQRSPFDRQWFLFGLGLIILGADWLCGPGIAFPILFVIPVMLAAWNNSRAEAIAMALVLVIARYFIQDRFGTSAAQILALNAFIRAIVLVSLGVLVSRVAAQNRELARRLTQLEGLLPICAHCKRIRDEDHKWTKLENYISAHSQAEFTHGICPHCAKEHYGIGLVSEAS